MGLDLFSKVRSWFMLGGRSDRPNPPNNPSTDYTESKQKRKIEFVGSEHMESRLYKYRRVDVTFPKYMPNEADDYTHMADQFNPRKEQDGNYSSNNNAGQTQKRLSVFSAPQTRNARVRNTQVSIPVDLSDNEEAQHNESNMYQAFADRLVVDVPSCTDVRRSSTNKPKLLYADAVRFGTHEFGDLNYQRPSSSASSSEVPLNGHGRDLYYPYMLRNSVLAVEDDRSDHNQYIDLISNLRINESDRGLSRAGISSRKPRDIEKPSPASRFQRTSPNRTDWLRSLRLNKPEPVTIDRLEYLKLLEGNSKYKSATATKKPPGIGQLSTRNDSIGMSSISNDITSDLSKDTPAVNKTSLSTRIVPIPLTKALEERHKSSKYFADDYSDTFNAKCARNQEMMMNAKELILEESIKNTEERQAFEQGLHQSYAHRRFPARFTVVLDDFDECEMESEPLLPPFTDEHQQRYTELVHGPGQMVLISKFSINITRNDIRTLVGSCWLNDEVINFYMNLLTERSERKEGKLPSVYAMNTFFVPRLLQNGYSGVKRWTRKVDLFSKDIIPVPVHVNGVHWCMAIIHLKNQSIKYYDSMGKPDHGVLKALEGYLREESLDKRHKPFDTSSFQIESVQNVPQQTNGSDCGVFSCMFAEFISRNQQLNFSQEHMAYFRKKMVLEICGGDLWL